VHNDEHKELDIICSEVYSVLHALGENYISRIDPDFLDSITVLRNKGYSPTIDPKKALNEQGLSIRQINRLTEISKGIIEKAI